MMAHPRRTDWWRVLIACLVGALIGVLLAVVVFTLIVLASTAL